MKEKRCHNSAKMFGTLHQILMEQATGEGPEVKMMTAVIARAVIDCKEHHLRYGQQEDAVDFVEGERLDLWAGVLGLDGDYVRRMARTAGYIQ